jgi:hypothetical protein
MASKPDTMGTAFCYGIEDRHTNGLLHVERLYRSNAMHFAWKLGWWVAHVLTTRPLRTEKPNG